MKKITIVNAHWSNRGDEAALRPVIDALLSDKDNKITVIFKDKNTVNSFPYDNVNYFSTSFLSKNINVVLDCIKNNDNPDIEEGLKKTVLQLKQSDMIIYSPGGAVISSDFWWEKQLEYLTPFICAKEFNIPIYVAAPSIGPFNQEKWKNNIIREYLQNATSLIVREPISNGYLKEIEIDAKCTIDTAFSYEIPQSDIFSKDNELKKFFESYSKIIAMTLSDFSWNVPLKNKKASLEGNEAVVKAFIKEKNEQGYGILLVPQLFGNQNDKKYLEKFTNNNVYIMSDGYDTYIQQYVISKCYALIGMRYHSNIFAAKGSVPFIAIGYEDKMFGFMKQWGLEDYLIYVDRLTCEELQEKWENLYKNYNEYIEKLNYYHEKWTFKAQTTINSLIEGISQIN